MGTLGNQEKGTLQVRFVSFKNCWWDKDVRDSSHEMQNNQETDTFQGNLGQSGHSNANFTPILEG